jgi:hypothetical protein
MSNAEGSGQIQPEGFSDKVAFVWKVADKLRGPFKPHEHGPVMLPFLVLRRLDAVLEPTKAKVLAKAEELEKSGTEEVVTILRKRATGPKPVPLRPSRFRVFTHVRGPFGGHVWARVGTPGLIWTVVIEGRIRGLWVAAAKMLRRARYLGRGRGKTSGVTFSDIEARSYTQ